MDRERFADMPRVMGDWRRAARARAKPRAPLPPPTRLTQPREVLAGEAGEMPSFEQLMQPTLQQSSSGAKPLFGLSDGVVASIVANAAKQHTSRRDTPWDTPWSCLSESAAIDRLTCFIGNGQAAVADRSLADVADANSSKLSVALALGVLSPRQVHAAAEGGGGEAAWLSSHMEMRDFFLYSAVAAGAHLFRREGTPIAAGRAALTDWRAPADADDEWRRWATGTTGLPLVDAAMRELIATGYCSNRVRQNAASLLTKDLCIDWRAGAELFQWLLADHDVAANWGNWQYFGGVGADPKQRHFRTISQAARYDPTGAYVRKWLTELRDVDDAEALLRPFDLLPERWPLVPIVDTATQLTWQDAARLEESGCVLETVKISVE